MCVNPVFLSPYAAGAPHPHARGQRLDYRGTGYPGPDALLMDRTKVTS